MMRNNVIYGLLLVAAVVAAAEASAQKYPERRMTREGNKAYERGDFEASELEYRRALEADPRMEEARFNLGNALFRQEKLEDAAKAYMDIAADSTSVPLTVSAASYNTGNVMLSGQQIEEAIEFYKQALRVNPDDMQAKYNLAYAKKLLQQPPPEDYENESDQDDNQDQDRNDDQDQDQDQDQDDNQDRDDQGDDDNDDQDNDGEQPEQPEPGGDNDVSIAPEEAEQMLEAIQDEEDKTREKMDAQEVPAVGRSGKNW